MNNNKQVKFTSEYRAFVYIFAALVTLASLPLLAYHYWVNLSGIALAAILGLAITDIVLWFASHWTVKARSTAMVTVSLVVKLALAAVMICNAATVVYVMRGEHRIEQSINQEYKNRLEELDKRKEISKELLKEEGGRSAAREAMKLPESKVSEIAKENKIEQEKIIPAWYLNFGIYLIPPIAAIIGFTILTITAAIIKRREDSEEQEETQNQPVTSRQPTPIQTQFVGERTFLKREGRDILVASSYPDDQSLVEENRRKLNQEDAAKNQQTPQKPVVTWRGNRVVSDSRGNGYDKSGSNETSH
jgi:uncharacterized membrane protein